jgi:hypothetical protein
MPTRDNPFDSPFYAEIRGTGLRSRTDISISGTEGVENPFDTFTPTYRTQVLGPGPSKLGSFAGGVKEGVLHPVRAIVGRDEPEERPDGWTLGNTVAEIAGEFAGFGLSFLPFFKATQLGLKGMGFGARAASGAFVRTPGFAIAEGGISGALFEAGSDLHEDVATRMAIGGTAGAAFDAVLVGIGRAWRGRMPKEMTVTDQTIMGPASQRPLIGPSRQLAPPGGVGRRVQVDPHPAAVSMERNLHPDGAKSFDEALVKMKVLQEDEQLEMAAVRVASVFRPLGLVELVGIQSPGQVVRSLKKVLPDSDILVAPQKVAAEETPLYKVLIMDREPRRALELVGSDLHQVKEQFLGGGKPSLTLSEAMDLIRKQTAAEEGIPVHHVPSKTVREAAESRFGDVPPGELHGFADLVQKDIWVRSTGDELAEQFDTLVHEFTHQVTWMISGSKLTPSGPVNLPEISRLLLGVDSVLDDATLFSARLNLEDELRNATAEVVRRRLKSQSLGEAIDITLERPDYFFKDSELLSRLAELMFIDPAKAREIAPQATRLFAERIEQHSPKLQKILSKTEHKVILQQLEGLWVKDADGSKLYKRVLQEFTPENRVQYQRHGHFEGMEVFLEGKPVVVSKAAVKAGDNITVRNPLTGLERTIPQGAVHYPILADMALRNKGIIEQVKQFLKKPPEWMGVVLRDKPAIDEAATLARKEAAMRKAREKLPDWWNEDYEQLLRERARQLPDGTYTVADEMGAYPAALGQGKGIVDNAGNIERLGLQILGVVEPQPIQRWTARKAIVKMEGFERVSSVDEFWKANKVEHAQVLRRLTENPPGEELTPEFIIKEILREKGAPGLIVNDNGRFMMFVADESAVVASPDQMAQRWFKNIDGEIGDPWIEPSHENAMESLLLMSGVSPRELDFFKKLNPFEDLLQEVAEENGLMGRIMRGSALAEKEAAELVAQGALTEPVEIAASRSGLRVDRTTDGELRLMSQSHEEILRTNDEAVAMSYINQTGPDVNVPILDADSPIPTAGAVPPPASRPPKPFEQLEQTWSQRLLDSTQLFGAVFTAMENFAKSAERRGFGAAFTRVFHPIQEGLQRVDHQLRYLKRDILQNRTFQEQVRVIEDLANQVGKGLMGKGAKQRQELVTRSLEQMSREEIAAPGGLLKRGMTENEINLANTIRGLGLQDDIPRLASSIRMAQLAVKNKTDFFRKVRALEQRGISKEFRETLHRMMDEIDEMPDNVPDILRHTLQLNEKELTVAGMIDSIGKAGSEDVSLFAISRYASASQEKGSGREAFMRLHEFSPIERKLAEETERAYKAAFEIHGLDSRKEIAGYWPHMRKWIEQGFGPREDFISNYLPESAEWSADRILSGELNIYNMDPVLTSYKHIRSMLMKQEVEPLLPDVREALAMIQARGANGERVHRIMSEYLHEAMGRPHASFAKVHQAIEMATEILIGKKVDPDFTRNVINSVGSVANMAAIPFRPLLILRNHFQTPAHIFPRTGISDGMRGLNKAMSEEGFKEAVEKGIVTHNVLPVHATTEVHGFDTSRLNRRLQRVFAKGFEWYQYPDDIGRATAFFAAKGRITRHEGMYRAGKISWEEFKARAKINTYDSIDIQRFEDLWHAGKFEDAKDYIGSRLARETIFRYGRANHPAGWGSVAGRLYGTFGTWPTQYKDYLLQGLARGSTRDRMEFLAIHSAINASMLGAGAAVGIDLMTWLSFPSLNYTGGPLADLSVSVIQSFGGSPTEQDLAKRNIRNMFPSLENPKSIFIPGSFFINDLVNAVTADGAGEAMFEGLGLRELRDSRSNPFAHMNW